MSGILVIFYILQIVTSSLLWIKTVQPIKYTVTSKAAKIVWTTEIAFQWNLLLFSFHY